MSNEALAAARAEVNELKSWNPTTERYEVPADDVLEIIDHLHEAKEGPR